MSQKRRKRMHRKSDSKTVLKKQYPTPGADFRLKSLSDIFFDAPCIFLNGKWWGAYSDRFVKICEPWTTPKEWFLSRKRVKESFFIFQHFIAAEKQALQMV